jgi:hypothetical protein
LAECKTCGFIFYKKKKKFIENWKEEVRPGDRIKVVGRSGNYYVGENGERTYLTNPGVYLVMKIHENGIAAIGTGKVSHGYEFLYMGEEKRSSMLDSMYNSPHKLIGVALKKESHND